MNEHLILLTLFVYVLAGVVKGAIGIGFPTAAIAFSALFLDARAAISLVVIPMILINAWQIYRSGNVIAIWIKNQALILSMVAMILLFSFFAAALSIKALTFTLGLITGGFAVVSLWKKMPRISNKHNLLAQVVAGLFSGMLGGIAAIWAPPIVMYLSARQVDTEEFVQTVGLMLFIGSIVLFIGYWQVGIVKIGRAHV